MNFEAGKHKAWAHKSWRSNMYKHSPKEFLILGLNLGYGVSAQQSRKCQLDGCWHKVLAFMKNSPLQMQTKKVPINSMQWEENLKQLSTLFPCPKSSQRLYKPINLMQMFIIWTSWIRVKSLAEVLQSLYGARCLYPILYVIAIYKRVRRKFWVNRKGSSSLAKVRDNRLTECHPKLGKKTVLN